MASMTTVGSAISAPGGAWVRTPAKLAAGHKFRLFCLPYAGGGASIYRTWQAGLPAAIQVCPVYLPGREARVREPLIRSYSELIGAITEVLLPYTREPYAFFGHSMGAFLGYETALRFIDAGLRAPEHLFVSGRQAPHIRCDFISKPVGQMTDGEFVDELAPLNDGSFRALMDNPELSALVMPSLRADFEVCQTYCPSNHVPIEVPITAFCGTSDASVTDKDTDAWRTATSGAFSLRIIPGDHFFVTASGRQIQQFIRTALMNT